MVIISLCKTMIRNILVVRSRTFMLRKELIGGQHPQAVQTSTQLSGYEQSWSISLLELSNLWAKKSWWKEFFLLWMTPEKCCTYTDHTFKVLSLIVAKERGITGEWSSWLFILNCTWTTIVLCLHILWCYIIHLIPYSLCVATCTMNNKE